MAMHRIPSPEASDEFADCWTAAARHVDAQGEGRINWLKADLAGPTLEHFSFRLENQLFFVRLEDIDRKLGVPGSTDGLLTIATGCKGVPCIMLMKKRDGVWQPHRAGWGVIDARTGHDIDPLALISDDQIEMTDWEVHDLAVQAVRDDLERKGRQIMSSQGNPSVDPSIWFTGRGGPEWVIVRAARRGEASPEPPNDWTAIAERGRALGMSGHFASVIVLSRDDAFDPDLPPIPLWRGRPVSIRFKGLQRLHQRGWLSSLWRSRR